MDEDSLARVLVKSLRAQGIDVVTAAEAGKLGASDDEQLVYAASQKRALCTANVHDFARLHDQWMEQGRHHAGILLVRQRMPLTVRLHALLRLLAAQSSETMGDRLEFLRNWVD
ncbi:MAG: DUF5615 family PIN-like protein [Chloroflexi bacterium]|nr:DUF5615 family PIN-like protein [Chloroflexota bacterium]